MQLSVIWYALVTVLLLGYFLLDGFDLGVGMLIGMRGHKGEGAVERRLLLNSIGPYWDGNEVWLVCGAGALFAAFPIWYADLFSMFYLPLLLLVVAMIIRAVSIEWRGKINSEKWQTWADRGILFGSIVPAFLWGVVFASLLHGSVSIEHGDITSDPSLLEYDNYGTFSLYSLLGGCVTLTLFLLHGCVFSVLKMEGFLRQRLLWLAYRVFGLSLLLTIVFTAWTVNMQYYGGVLGRNVTGIAVVLIAIGYFLLSLGLHYGKDIVNFLATSAVIAGVALILLWHNYPVLIVVNHSLDQSLTISRAASSAYTLKVMTWAAVCFVPIVVGYQAWSYWIFHKRLSPYHIPTHVGISPKATSEQLQAWKDILTNTPESDEELASKTIT